MLRYRGTICGVLVALMVTGDVGRVAMAGGPPFFRRSKPKSCLEQAANEVDRLERELNQTGTVVIKAPDIWGESRLTKHRQEFEREMEKQITGFELRLNANIRRSDQAYLANALALQAALPGGTITNANAAPTFVNSLTSGTIAGTPAQVGGQQPAVTDTTPIARTNIYTGTTATTANFAGFASGIGLEPTIELDQMKRYLDHLNEIRRVNEGDDTSDSPGYSLNLVRIPVSLLPGEMTRAGHGAEVTITAKPHVSPELLPKVYRDLVINDIVDSLALSMVKISEHIDSLAFETDGCGRVTGKWNAPWQQFTEEQRINAALGNATSEPTNPSNRSNGTPTEAVQAVEADPAVNRNYGVRNFLMQQYNLNSSSDESPTIAPAPPVANDDSETPQGLLNPADDSYLDSVIASLNSKV